MTASVGSMIFGVGALLEADIARTVQNSSTHGSLAFFNA